MSDIFDKVHLVPVVVVMVVGILVVVIVVDLVGVVLIEVVIVVGISGEGIVSVTAFLILFSVVVSSVAEVGLQWFAKENQQSPVYVVNCHFS